MKTLFTRVACMFIVVLMCLLTSLPALAAEGSISSIAQDYEQLLDGKWVFHNAEKSVDGYKADFEYKANDPESNHRCIFVNATGEAYLADNAMNTNAALSVRIIGKIYFSEDGNILWIDTEDGDMIFVRDK